MTQQERTNWEIQCYGCTEEQLNSVFVRGWAKGLESLHAMGILSDAQEVISDEFGEPDIETCRQFINRAKYFIAKSMNED